MSEGKDLRQGMRPLERPIQVRSITVKTGRLVCDVAVSSSRYRYTTPGLAAFAEGQYPDLPHHACVNDKGPAFGDVMEATSTPHLIEHVAISLQTRAAVGSDASFTGTTEWIDEEAGEARIQLSFQDDLEALRAFNDATQFVNMAVLTCIS
jgi:hypothetical protein